MYGLALLIRILHICLIAFVICVPFMKIQWPIAVLHLTTVLSLLAHWYVDKDTCFLTILETVFLGSTPNTSFMHQLVSPVYKIQDADLKKLVWYITPVLGLMSAIRIWNSRDLIKRELSIICNSRQQYDLSQPHTF
jgi:hypothetical protein